ncbi:nucleolar protein 12-like isoform X2 [Maniola jurtina]|uniref:nucleolar protein 12-like isoform X2 n=1 Tax=Maniola jurtina TaxID=191418 RepID=UPI001E68F078|nr:nucleolar protein 12-like isoform X2 [Maniola jurtina]
MDYVVGSIAALLTGNVTPNRPKPLKNAKTPMKNQPSPNVTPKSEFVEDRSIFLSPTMQKKKAIVKKSPKRIFQNSDLDGTNGEHNDSSLLSPKADKVKKHLKNDLEADSLAPTVLLSPKSPKNSEMSPRKGNKKRSIDNIIVTDDNTLKKKKRISEIGNDDNIIQNAKEDVPNAEAENSPKKKVKRRKSVMEINCESSLENNISKKKNKKSTNEFTIEEFNIVTEEINTNTSVNENQSPKKDKKKKKNKSKQNGNIKIESKDTNEGEIESENKEVSINAAVTETPGAIKKKKKRRKKKSKQTELTNSANSSTVTNIEGDSITEHKSQNASTVTQDPVKKKKNRKKKKSKQTEEQIESLNNSITNMEVDSIKNESENTSKDNPEKKKKKSKLAKNNDQADPGASEPVKVNPNAVTSQDTDSEHDSDDEIDSENEEDNKKVLDTGPADDSSDEAPDKGKKDKEGEQKVDQLIAEDELKRTLFVGNVPFSGKTKKEMKKIFSKHGKIETVRIRTVPVKDARDTPKLAVIKKELHPDRTTVHVYIRFSTALAVEKALVENNTVLNGCHLRVQPSESSGVPHDPKCSIFVGNIPFTLEDEALRGKFEKCGDIESVRIVRDRATCIGKGMGFVNFKSKDSVELALAMTEEDLTIKNRILRVKRCTAPTENQLKRRQHNNQGMASAGKKFGGGTQTDSGKKKIIRRQEQGNETGNSGRDKFGGRPNTFGRNENFRRQDRGNEAGSFNRGKFGDRQNDFGKGNFRRQDQGNESRNFSRGKFGDRQNDFGKKENFRRQDQGNKAGNFSRGKFDGQDADKNSGAYRRVMNKRKNEDSGEGPPTKRQNVDQPPREKKERKEFVGMTAEKKKVKKQIQQGIKEEETSQ